MLRGQTPTRDLVQGAFDRARKNNWRRANTLVDPADVIATTKAERPAFLWIAYRQLRLNGVPPTDENVFGMISQQERLFQKKAVEQGAAAANDWFQRKTEAAGGLVDELMRGGYSADDLGAQKFLDRRRIQRLLQGQVIRIVPPGGRGPEAE